MTEQEKKGDNVAGGSLKLTLLTVGSIVLAGAICKVFEVAL